MMNTGKNNLLGLTSRPNQPMPMMQIEATGRLPYDIWAMTTCFKVTSTLFYRSIHCRLHIVNFYFSHTIDTSSNKEINLT